jgi:mRNA-degrading endonuclease toxin of MazEF toxin-antitoxin module
VRSPLEFSHVPRTLHKNLLSDYIGELPAERMAELNVKLAYSLGLL